MTLFRQQHGGKWHRDSDRAEPVKTRAVDATPTCSTPLSWVRPMYLKRAVVGTAVVLLLFYTVAGYLGSADMFGDHPCWRGMNRGPVDFGLRGETVSFDTEDHIRLKAWWLPASSTPRGTIIVAHGIDHTRQVMLVSLVHGGYDVLLFDLRGHGESGGRIVSPGLLEARDLLGALRYVRVRVGDQPIVLMGVSYGAVAALVATGESPEVSAVIADGAFTNGRDVSDDISRHFADDPRTTFWVRTLFRASSLPGVAQATALVYYARAGIWLGPELLSVIPWASRIRVPVLFISGQRDWIVPTSRARQIFAAVPDNRKRLVVIPNAVHDTTYSSAPTLYASSVLDFLGTYVDTNDSPRH